MELNHEFSVSLPVSETWAVLTDLERVAPCMPGFELQEVEGEEYRGIVKVKVGPMTAQYKGVASFQERDAASHRAVVRAEGREMRGQGNASALVTATLAPEGTGTRVHMHTDLTVTGRVAQFGRGVLADVSGKLIGEFAKALEADLSRDAGPAAGESAPTEATGLTDEPAPATPSAEPAVSGPRRVESAPAEPVDLLASAGPSVLKRALPIAALLAVALWLWLRG